MFKPEYVRKEFPDAAFNAPATADTIAAAERLLGHPLPVQLRALYLDFDGFLGPTNAPFLLPLLERPRPGGESLVTYTLFFRGEGYFPDWVHRAVVLGDNGTGMAWFLLLDEDDKLVVWDAEWEDYEVVDGTLLDEWRREKQAYDAFLASKDFT